MYFGINSLDFITSFGCPWGKVVCVALFGIQIAEQSQQLFLQTITMIKD